MKRFLKLCRAMRGVKTRFEPVPLCACCEHHVALPKYQDGELGGVCAECFHALSAVSYILHQTRLVHGIGRCAPFAGPACEHVRKEDRP